MGVGVYSPIEAYWFTGGSPVGVTTSSALDLRASNGNFIHWISGSGLAAGAANSALLNLQHSFDLTAWWSLSITTASAPSFVTAQFSGGAYAYLRSVATIYSGATGTGAPYQAVYAGHV